MTCSQLKREGKPQREPSNEQRVFRILPKRKLLRSRKQRLAKPFPSPGGQPWINIDPLPRRRARRRKWRVYERHLPRVCTDIIVAKDTWRGGKGGLLSLPELGAKHIFSISFFMRASTLWFPEKGTAKVRGNFLAQIRKDERRVKSIHSRRRQR